MVGSEGVSADDGGMEKFSKNLTNSEGVCYTLAREASSRGRVCAGVRESGMPEASASHPPPPPLLLLPVLLSPKTPLSACSPPLDTERGCLEVERGWRGKGGREREGRGRCRKGMGARGYGGADRVRPPRKSVSGRRSQNGGAMFPKRANTFPKAGGSVPKTAIPVSKRGVRRYRGSATGYGGVTVSRRGKKKPAPCVPRRRVWNCDADAAPRQMDETWVAIWNSPLKTKMSGRRSAASSDL